jgi:Mg-chelatase subunit ChlD
MQKYLNKKKALLLLAVLALYLVIITPLLIINLQTKQELRGKAQTISPSPTPLPGQSCVNAYTDTVIIFDESESMNYPIDEDHDIWKLQAAKNAARSFVDLIAVDARNKTSLVSFEDDAAVDSQLTNDFNSVKNIINGLGTEDGDTCHQCAVNKANEEISARGRTNVKKIAILLTDGLANRIEDVDHIIDREVAKEAAITAVENAFTANNIIFYTIGLGSYVDEDFLEQIADMTGGKYYFSPTTDELEEIYQEISQEIGRGQIEGFKFNDINGDGVFATNEAKLRNWNIELSSGGGTLTFTTDADGNYRITELCDGNYQLQEVLKSGWQQTLPVSPSGYPILIANGSSFTDKNFGNMIAPTATPTPIPTTTPTPAATLLNLTIYQHGIGNSGDNTNPNDTNLSNKKPVHTTINADLELFNANNQLIGKGHGPVKYSSSSGNFQGTLEIYPNTFPSGKYYLKVKTNFHLKRLVPGILTIIAGQKNTVPPATLVTGDANNDNKLNILDYNLLLDCYSDLSVAVACDPDKKIATDFNDDSFVNQFDYNLFLREIATQPGQ